MASPPEELTLSATTPVMAAKAWGPPEGPRVLALHGWLDNAASFDLVAPALAAAGMRVVAIDFAGHGCSGHKSSDAAGYAFVDWAYDVEQAAQALGWTRFSLLGHSMGAAVASLYASTFPHKVIKLAAIEGLVPLTASAGEFTERLAAHFAARQRARLSNKQLVVYKDVATALAVRMQVSEFPVEASIEGVVRRSLMPVVGGWSWRSDPRLRWPSAQRLTPEQALSMVSGIVAPVLLVRARQGLPIALSYFQQVRAAVANLTVVELDGGHHVHLQHADGVAAALREFFAD